ncbi:MAG: CO2 hydration protein [Leptolyngbyaceae cyanobacterium SM1_1_3]|nr:CO2 hydration protein [Leptolyngbyaceae cyanobacterium SM1_1_3]NJN01224.1 CO2 hydration protein [Leptolyngbyaceae cyanobacterium RM1_1_2]NJO09065.1 CO2 hydration protein [Leptolyngbyaceae cyanobacterium SL_1_1]
MTEMPSTWTSASTDTYITRLLSGQALLPDTGDNVLEVVGILKSYGIVLDAYSKNLIYIAEHQFLVLFPFFKYFNGEVTFKKLLRHWWHDRINYEYAEYCMRTMLWHGGGRLAEYLHSDEFNQLCDRAVQAKVNPLLLALNRLSPQFLPEQVRQLAYYSGLGQFWRVMSDLFLALSNRYDAGEVTSIADVVEHTKAGLVEAATKPITYGVEIGDQHYWLLPPEANLTFLMDTAVPYVETIFFRGAPFQGTVSYNAQANQISPDQSRFAYGALYADPLPVGGAGIPPTLLMQDMRHYLPDYLRVFYRQGLRGEEDIRVKICQSFQKSMFCVTTAAIMGLLPFAPDTANAKEQKANYDFLASWIERLKTSRLDIVQIT